MPTWKRDPGSAAYFVDRLRTVVAPAHNSLLTAVRRRGGKVVFLRVGAFDETYADLTPGFKGIGRWHPRADAWETQVIEGIDVQPGDISLIKTGSGGFYTSGLDSHLRNMGIDTVVYTGVITNSCGLLTSAGGFDRGYRGLLAADATATLSPKLQATAELLIDGYIANVVEAADVVRMLDEGDLSPRAAERG